MVLSNSTRLITPHPSELDDEEESPNHAAKADVYMINPWGIRQRRKAVVIRAHISNCQIGQIYTNTGAGAEVMFEHCFLQLPESIRRQKKTETSPLAGFNSTATWPVGSITLEVVLGKLSFQSTADLEFSLVKTNSRYNVIIGRNAVQKFGAVTSTVHGMLKFPTPADIATIRTQELESVECLQILKGTYDIIVYDDGYVSPNPKYPEQRIQIGTNLSANTKDTLYKLLAANIDVFVWEPSDMTRVPREIAQHRLNVNPNITPVIQKKRAMALERSKFLDDEVQRLVDAGIMNKVKYQTWVANPVMVKKADGSWRMCVDYKDINKACPKDNYPLPEIDWISNLSWVSGSRASWMRTEATSKYQWQKSMRKKLHSSQIKASSVIPKCHSD
ncbi:uncharacterized protein [Rutidosis leptorrhynchoides]|uniref:uncharacterized protein n=1 Tax=Rutidosis leptorrhynchoides TaxID=125765 RepID=UPI003A99B1BB